jgi:glyoxylase-like metal-dependent hydrolase (beta-lactamase superfamily II)
MRRFSLCLAVLLAACAGAPPKPAAPQARIDRESAGDPRIGTYVSVPRGFDTSSYWIEGPDGLVLIDTQFLPSATVELANEAERLTGKKIALAIVLHPNPDKFNGTATLQQRGVKVVTSAQVAALIPEVHKLRTKWFYQRYKPDYPRETPKPDVFGDATTTLEAAGLQLKAHVLGPGCSGAQVAVEFDGHLFVGDLVANHNHAWMELGLLDEWKARLNELKALHPKFVHPGRGATGGPELLDDQIAYLDRVRAIVSAAGPKGELDKPTQATLEKAVQDAFPGYGYPYFLKLGLPAVWKSLAATPAQTSAPE